MIAPAARPTREEVGCEPARTTAADRRHTEVRALSATATPLTLWDRYGTMETTGESI